MGLHASSWYSDILGLSFSGKLKVTIFSFSPLSLNLRTSVHQLPFILTQKSMFRAMSWKNKAILGYPLSNSSKSPFSNFGKCSCSKALSLLFLLLVFLYGDNPAWIVIWFNTS